MPDKATGYVSYQVKTECPHCERSLQLNDYPYTNGGELELGEDELGLAVFCTTTNPATWQKFEIIYKCFFCKKDFTLTNLET